MFTRNDVRDIYPLSPMQKGMLFHYIKDKNSEAYFEQIILTIAGSIDVDLFEKSFNALIEKYDILRTIFTYEKTKEPKQIVLKRREGKVYFEDLTHLKDDAQAEYIDQFTAQDRQTGFNLKVDIPMRISILKLSEEQSLVIWSHHHIIMDGWCLGLLMQDFFPTYQALKEGREAELTKARPYSTFIKWLYKQDEAKGLNYWGEYLKEYEEKALIPHSFKGTQNKYSLCKVFHRVEKGLTAELGRLARETQVTINTIMQVAWGILMQRYNNVQDVVFGAVVSGRPSEIPGIERMVGLFINNIPVRVKYEQGDSFQTLVQKVQKEVITSEQYNYLSLADIQGTTELKHDLMDHILVFENYPLKVKDQIDQLISKEKIGFTVTDVESVDQTNYNFGIVIIPDEEMTVELKFNGAVYSQRLMERLGGHLIHILREVVQAPEQDLAQLNIVTPAERKMIFEELNQTELDVPANLTIDQLFAEQVAKTPDHRAVTYAGESLTYRELNGRANQLARHLQKWGVGRDRIVGLMVKPSLEMVVGILAVLKAGGAYLPIDPEHPVERILYMLEDSQSHLLLTQTELMEQIPFSGKTVDLSDQVLYQGDESNLDQISQADDLVYVIYTSGTTGKPKGVLLQHKNLVNYVSWFADKANLTEEDRGLLTSSFAFDLGYTSLYPSILFGAELHLIEKETYLAGKRLLDYIQRNQITYLKVTPSLFKIITSSPNFTEETCQSLRLVLLGGEEINLADVEKAYTICPNLKMMNHYGPTEATIGCIAQFIDGDQFAEYQALPTIGRPIANTKVYILDKEQRPLPIGIPGEICVAGRGLARGYLNRDELTAEKFIQIPGLTGTERVYRTGDRGRFLENGRIEFMGRIDQQVKIRGYRVEPEEIANRIAQAEQIKEAAVIAKTDQDQTKYLCAYVVSDGELDLACLREFLQGELPNYMIPSYFVQLDEMPLTPNGKLNRKALPEPDGAVNLGGKYAAPRNELEEKLVAIWEEILNRKRIGIHDHFFELGGHSLKATIFTSRVHKELDLEIPLTEVFNSPTIAGLSDYLRQAKSNPYASIEPTRKQEYYPISSAQKRLLIINEKEGADVSYNMVGAMTIVGQLDLERFEAGFRSLIQRHETLRTSFHLVDGEYVQKVHDLVEFKIEMMEKGEDQLPETVQQFIQPFDLSQAPLLRVGLVKVGIEKHILLFDMHHIISDGTSMGILIREFIHFYEGDDLDELRIQYKDYTAWQHEFSSSELMVKQEQYWLEQFAGELPVLRLPTDYPRPARQSFEGKRIHFTVDQDLTKALKEVTLETGSTLYMVLMAAFNLLLYKYTGQEDLIVGSPIAGRPHTDLEHIIGMFINTLPMRNKPCGEQTFREFLAQVKGNALKAYENQDYQFERLVDQLDLKRDLSRNPLFDVAFTLQNMERTQIQLDDLRFEHYEFENNIAKFDLLMLGIESNGQIDFAFEYLTKLYKESTVEQMKDHYIQILQQLVLDLDRKLQDFEISLAMPTTSAPQIDDGDFGF